MKKLKTILASVLCALFASSAFADVYYGATGSLGTKKPHGELYIIDPITGITTDVGALNDAAGNNYTLTGLVYVTSQDQMYGITTGDGVAPNSLVKVDLETALITPIGPLGTRITDATYDASTDTVFAVSGSSKFFYTINLTTGTAVRFSTTGIPPQNGGAIAIRQLLGGTFGATVSDVSTGAVGFYSYSADGKAMYVGDCGTLLIPRAMTSSSVGVLYGVIGGTLRAPSVKRWIAIFDPVTGMATILTPTVDVLDAFEYVP